MQIACQAQGKASRRPSNFWGQIWETGRTGRLNNDPTIGACRQLLRAAAYRRFLAASSKFVKLEHVVQGCRVTLIGRLAAGARSYT